MYGGWSEWLARDRMARELAAAEERKLARLVVARSTLRARAARWLFNLAVALQRDETWRAVWEGLEAPRRP